jgi:hypothetical protein
MKEPSTSTEVGGSKAQVEGRGACALCFKGGKPHSCSEDDTAYTTHTQTHNHSQASDNRIILHPSSPALCVPHHVMPCYGS